MLPIAVLLGASCYSEDSDEPEQEYQDDPVIDSLEEPDPKDTIPLINIPFCEFPTQAISDPGLSKFIRKLKKAVALRDTLLLFSLMEEGVISSHGGGVIGYAGVKESWNEGREDLWKCLGRLMQFGGIQEHDSVYRIPYFSNLQTCTIGESLEGKVDWYITWFTTNDTTFLYEQPTSQSSVKAKFVASLVNCWEPMKSENGFLKCETLDGKLKGYMRKDDIYRLGDNNLIIEKNQKGQWLITAFAPFD